MKNTVKILLSLLLLAALLTGAGLLARRQKPASYEGAVMVMAEENRPASAI